MPPRADFAYRYDITDRRPNSIVQMGVCHVPEGRHVFRSFRTKTRWRVRSLQKIRPAQSQNRIERGSLSCSRA